MIRLHDLLHKEDVIASLSSGVVCLQSEQYPLLLSKKIAEYLARKHDLSCTFQSMNSDSIASTMAALQTSFLGTRACYWLGSLDELSKGKQKQWTDFLQSYSGPHIILFFSAASFSTAKSITTIQIPQAVDARSIDSLAVLFNEKRLSFKSELFMRTDKLFLDELYLFMKYDGVLGKGADVFAKEWLSELIVPELSLFSLSQALFDKKPLTFYRQWKALAQKYGAPFWVTFWSEQMWRAYHYVVMQKKGKALDAKKVGYRLPFSFLNRTWRKYSPDDLQSYHQQLYEIDFQIKNGGSAHALDLFYARFMS